MRINAIQPNFDIERCLNNIQKLSYHFIDTFRRLNDGLGVFEFLIPRSDMRCNLMLYHLIQWELMAIFAPQEIKVDIFDLLCVRGGGFFQYFVHPTGHTLLERMIRNEKSRPSLMR